MNAEHDLRYVRAAVESLEEFLLTDDIFFPLSGTGLLEGPSTRLSLGILDLSLSRLKAGQLPEAQKLELAHLEDRIQRIKDQWRSAWSRKAAREFKSRLHLWQNYLNDTFRDLDQYSANYGQEVRMRVMLGLLRQDVDSLPSEDETLLEAMDRRLKAKFTLGDFIWDPSLISIFPQDRYWFLYGQLKG